MKNPQFVKNLISEDLVSDLYKFANLREESVSQITLDSREIENCPDSVLFFAIEGKNVDGHRFIDAVFKKNPRSIVVSEKDLHGRYDRSIRVNDIQKTMAMVAKKFFGNPDEKLHTVAITGTNGKTTIAYLCRAMLKKIEKCGMLGTIEYDICGESNVASNTTPPAINLFKMLSDAVDNGCNGMVFEASSHAIEQKRVFGLSSDVAVFTNLTQEHLDFHKDLNGYFSAKKKLFDGMNGSIPKASIVNIDDHYGRKLFDSLKNDGLSVESFGFSPDADFLIYNVQKNDVAGSIFEIIHCGMLYKIKTSLFGIHNLSNIAAAFASCMKIYNRPDLFIEAIAGFKCVPGRLDRIELPNGVLAFVDYAHTPDALKVVMTALNSAKTGKLITVFGCGGNRDTMKRAPMTRVANEMSDFAIATSDNPREEALENIFNDMKNGVVDTKKIMFIESRREAISRAVEMSSHGDVILIAGKGHETYQLIGGQTFGFDDKKVLIDVAGEIFKRRLN